MNYTQLTQEQRYQIYALNKAGFTQSLIAQELKVHKSTVCRELKRNTGQRGYRPKQAHEWAASRQQQRACATRISPQVWHTVKAKLQEEWSPQQISGRLKIERDWNISHERIYQYIYDDKRNGGTLHQHLRCQKQRRKRYGGGRDRRGQIAQRQSIEDRPPLVEERERLGDWEVDTIVGKGHQEAMLSLVERRSRFTLLHKLERATSAAVTAAALLQLQPVAEKVKSITSDNGREFAGHQDIAATLAVDFYFAHPYAAWERGTNENTNGLVRQYFPKGSDFTSVTQDHVEAVVAKLNHRPRKVLGYRTPHEVFYATETVALTT
jgi:IS30 family transposase